LGDGRPPSGIEGRGAVRSRRAEQSLLAAVASCAVLALAGCGGGVPCAGTAKTLAPVVATPDAKSVLDPLALRGTQAGAEPLVVVASGLLAEGDRVGGFVSLPPERCVVFFARGSAGVADLDLFAFADDGSTIAADESSSSDAAVLICPPVPERMFLSARVASGAGLVAIGAEAVAVAEAPRVAHAVGARAMGEDSGRLESWPGLEAKIRAHRRTIGSDWQDVRRFAAPVDPRAPTKTSLTIEPGRCLDVLVTPSEEVASLEVVAESSDGRIVARADSDGRDRTMVVCSELGDPITISARPRGNAGLAAFVLARSAKGARAELERTFRVDATTQIASPEVARLALAKTLDPTWGKARPAGGGQAKVGGRASLPIKLGPGCTRLDVVAGAPLGPVDAALWATDGALLAESDGPLRASLFTCGDAARDARLDVEAAARPGPFVVDQRVVSASGSSLDKVPIAAGRLLDRVVGNDALALSAASSATLVDLMPDKLFDAPMTVPVGGCTEVVAALDAGGSGIEVRIVDVSTEEDFIARGRFVTSQRICATDVARRARIELRLDSGPARGLLLLRPLPP